MRLERNRRAAISRLVTPAAASVPISRSRDVKGTNDAVLISPGVLAPSQRAASNLDAASDALAERWSCARRCASAAAFDASAATRIKPCAANCALTASSASPSWSTTARACSA